MHKRLFTSWFSVLLWKCRNVDRPKSRIKFYGKNGVYLHVGSSWLDFAIVLFIDILFGIKIVFVKYTNLYVFVVNDLLWFCTERISKKLFLHWHLENFCCHRHSNIRIEFQLTEFQFAFYLHHLTNSLWFRVLIKLIARKRFVCNGFFFVITLRLCMVCDFHSEIYHRLCVIAITNVYARLYTFCSIGVFVSDCVCISHTHRFSNGCVH